MKKILGFAGAIALSIIPTPSFSGEVEQKEMMSVTEQLLPQIGEKYYYLNKKEKKTYKKNLLKYLKKVEKLEPTGVGEAFSLPTIPPTGLPTHTEVGDGVKIPPEHTHRSGSG